MRTPIAFTPRKAALLIGGAVFVLIFGYALLTALPIIQGPALEVTAQSSLDGVTTLSGRTERVSYLILNGEPIPIEEGGEFSVLRAFPSGYTEVTVIAKDRFGRELVTTLGVVTGNTEQEKFKDSTSEFPSRGARKVDDFETLTKNI